MNSHTNKGKVRARKFMGYGVTGAPEAVILNEGLPEKSGELISGSPLGRCVNQPSPPLNEQSTNQEEVR